MPGCVGNVNAYNREVSSRTKVKSAVYLDFILKLLRLNCSETLFLSYILQPPPPLSKEVSFLILTG